MIKIRKKIISLFLIAIFVLQIITTAVYDDMEPKPSFTVYVTNYDNQNYYLDL